MPKCLCLYKRLPPPYFWGTATLHALRALPNPAPYALYVRTFAESPNVDCSFIVAETDGAAISLYLAGWVAKLAIIVLINPDLCRVSFLLNPHAPMAGHRHPLALCVMQLLLQAKKKKKKKMLHKHRYTSCALPLGCLKRNNLQWNISMLLKYSCWQRGSNFLA